MLLAEPFKWTWSFMKCDIGCFGLYLLFFLECWSLFLIQCLRELHRWTFVRAFLCVCKLNFSMCTAVMKLNERFLCLSVSYPITFPLLAAFAQDFSWSSISSQLFSSFLMFSYILTRPWFPSSHRSLPNLRFDCRRQESDAFLTWTMFFIPCKPEHDCMFNS